MALGFACHYPHKCTGLSQLRLRLSVVVNYLVAFLRLCEVVSISLSYGNVVLRGSGMSTAAAAPVGKVLSPAEYVHDPASHQVFVLTEPLAWLYSYSTI